MSIVDITIDIDSFRCRSFLFLSFISIPAGLDFSDQIGALIDEVVLNAKKLVQATSREIEKWRRRT